MPELPVVRRARSCAGPADVIMRRRPLQRIVMLLIILTIFKIASSRFLGAYGVYIVAGVAVIALEWPFCGASSAAIRTRAWA